ncbi:MAG TPA: aminoglycoside phosphotransferase family protein [Ktedonobacterales bacterium]
MSAGKMHVNEVETDIALVRRLLAAQMPEWAQLSITPVRSGGTDHAIYRLGEELAVRLPRIESATVQAEKEFVWLPRLAPLLPLAIPVPLAKGAPGEGYPWKWSVYRWLAGETASVAHLDGPNQAARDLAGFITALWGIPTIGWPPPEPPMSYRDTPLVARDAAVREALTALDGQLDAEAVVAAWERSLAAPVWDAARVWVHADLLPLNLLVNRGRFSAVIDFGLLGLGDPAVDVMPAWTLFSGESRATFRAALAVDDATWERGRGWALSFGLIALPYYQRTNPALAAVARRAIDGVLADRSATMWRPGRPSDSRE